MSPPTLSLHKAFNGCSEPHQDHLDPYMVSNPSKSSQRSQFVEDLVYMVLESSDHWWPGDLLQLAQVSSAWLGPIRRRLYATPNIHSFRSCARLTHTLSTNPSLLALVKGVELRIMPGTDRHVNSEDRAGLNYILSIEGLLHITLGGLLSVKAERFLYRVANAHTVSDLHIDGRSMAHSLSPADYPSLDWDESIVFQFCNLQALHLTDVELAISPPSIPYSLQLSHLHLDHVTISRGYLSQLLQETPSLPWLRVRTGCTQEFDEQVRCVLDCCAVEELEFEVDEEGPLIHPIFDNNSSSLRSLRLINVHVDIDTLNIIGDHCRQLENFAISGRLATIPPREWISFIRAGNLAHLRCLGLSCGFKLRSSANWNNSAVDELLKTATQHGIHVSII